MFVPSSNESNKTIPPKNIAMFKKNKAIELRIMEIIVTIAITPRRKMYFMFPSPSLLKYIINTQDKAL